VRISASASNPDRHVRIGILGKGRLWGSTSQKVIGRPCGGENWPASAGLG
jgi:hypothetical protein